MKKFSFLQSFSTKHHEEFGRELQSGLKRLLDRLDGSMDFAAEFVDEVLPIYVNMKSMDYYYSEVKLTQAGREMIRQSEEEVDDEVKSYAYWAVGTLLVTRNLRGETAPKVHKALSGLLEAMHQRVQDSHYEEDDPIPFD